MGDYYGQNIGDGYSHNFGDYYGDHCVDYYGVHCVDYYGDQFEDFDDENTGKTCSIRFCFWLESYKIVNCVQRG